MADHSPYSPSKIGTAGCPFAFKKRYIDKEKGIRNPIFDLGSVIHLILAKMLQREIAGVAYDDDEIITRYMRASVRDRIGELKKQVWLFHNYFTYNIKNVVGVEERMAIDRHGNGAKYNSSFVRGILDLIEIDGDTCIITDHKSQFHILPDSEMAKHQQLRFYCFMVMHFWPQVTKFITRIYFTRFGVTKSAEISIDQVQRFGESLRISIDHIENMTEWPAIPGDTCTICSYYESCPHLKRLGDETDEPRNIHTNEDAVFAAKLLRVREEQVKRIKANLKEYCSHVGSVDISDDFSYGFRSMDVNNWNVRKVFKALMDFGQDPFDSIAFNATKLKKILAKAQKEDPTFAAELEAALKVSRATRFSGYPK